MMKENIDCVLIVLPHVAAVRAARVALRVIRGPT